MPKRGKLYSPPIEEVTVNVARVSPKREGSKVMSMPTSDPPLELGAAVTALSQWKSELSIWIQKEKKVKNQTPMQMLWPLLETLYE